MFAAGAVEGLLFGVGGQDAEEEGFAGSEAEVGQSLCYGLVDVFVVLGFAFDDAAQADDGIRVFLSVQDAGAGGQLKGAGHLHGVDVFGFCAVFEQGVVAAFV